MTPLAPTEAGLLLTYSLAYFLVAFVWRSVHVWRTTGVNPMVLTADDSAYGYVGRGMRGVLLTWLALVVAAVAIPPLLASLGPLSALHRPAVGLLGWALLLGSLVWIAAAQVAMGASWRIGIDRAVRTALVRTGPFARSRNPIFLGMRVNLLGLFLVLPNAVTLGKLIAGELLMQVQVRLEEAHLQAVHGDAYADYRRQVRRWL
ncbi:methyltransferase family protein [Deinococcus ficus]|uniref:methyltransferase family protein n=1 Tax=Deinococcus ficus TaxID=317577 RepID=UPI0003B6AE78|nr:isoprenylcysteine carboxylmethyltransferase family protein [Deinococcus ficus]